MKYKVPLCIFLLSQTSWVISYLLSRWNLMQSQVSVFIAGVVTLALVTAVPYVLFLKLFKRVDPIVLVLTVFCWSCMIDLSIGLEIDGFISNFMGFYFAEGEPYLQTAHGAVICYWDGIVHFVLGMVIITQYTQRQSYRAVGLYWVGSILNSMIVLLPGGIAGNHPFKLSILLNIPYLILPLLAGFKFLRERPVGLQETKVKKFHTILNRPVDFLFFIYFIGAILLSIFRGLAVLNGNALSMKEYIKSYEPYLVDLSNFPKFQMLVYGYFFLVYYLAAAYALLFPGQQWMADWSLIHAGASAQAQFSHIAGSLHHRTPMPLHPPTTGIPCLIFWLVNIILLVIPQLFAWRCYCNPESFGPISNVGQSKHKHKIPSRKAN
ncbi:transmembrane 6 superfamily member 1-like [Physella acuta]|uniref:transmembrane 6 superfamily member 1-like n=1 Tax=Physella acuta TaxID=109671 RepID=UPI0027DDE066|nr:transmembrane 6 superfamily member 1-like [Physella acuta]